MVNDMFYRHLLNIEFKAYEGTKEKVGGFDKMSNMLKKEA
jgi:hypothetical protein